MAFSRTQRLLRLRVLFGAAVVALAGVVILSGLAGGVVHANITSSSNESHLSDFSSSWSVHSLRSSPLVAAPYSEPGLRVSGAINLGPATVPFLPILVSFPIQHSSELAAFLANLSNPSSPLYRHYLTATMFDTEYGGSATDYDAAVAYFQSFGVTYIEKSADRLTLTFEASPLEIQQIFHVTIDSFNVQGRSYLAPDGPPELPSLLASSIASIEGLSTYSALLVHTNSFSSPIHALTTHQPAHGLSTAGYIAPATYGGVQYEYAPDFQIAYDEPSLFNDSGYPTNAVIATILWSGSNVSATPVGPFVPTDIYDFFNETLPAGEPHPHVYGVPLNGAPPPGPSASYDATGANGENTLDLEMAGSTAPGASIYNVYGPSATTANLDAAFGYILNPTGTPGLANVNVITNSWGGPDSNDTTWYSDLQEAQARGISVLASSGDSGDNPSSSKYLGGPDYTEFPSAMAYNDFGDTAVGGTTVDLNPTGSSPLYLHLTSQTAWYISAADSADGGPAGSTGGISSVFPEPSWQLGTSANSVISGAGRGVPDIAAIANNTLVTITIDGYQYLATNATYGDPFEHFWGTSIASPLEAGVVAEIDHVLAAHSNGPLGYLNPMLYSVANHEYAPLPSNATGIGAIATGSYAYSLPTTPLLDVISGSNYGYAAGIGYDLVTGWGSLDAYNYTMYVLQISSAGIFGHLAGVQDRVDLTGLKVYSTGSGGGYNGSTQQNFFLANSLGAPVYWIQNVVYISGQPGAWQMRFTGWVVFPFWAAYPTISVYEYNWPASSLGESTPLNFNFTTQLSSAGTLGAQIGFSFGVTGASTLTLPVPGASFIIGSLNYSYSWQGTNYTNGGPAFVSGAGFLSPQFGLVGGPSLGLGHFQPPTGGTLSAWVEPSGSTNYLPAATQTFGLTRTQTGEDAVNLVFNQTSGNDWTIGTQSGSQTQGVLCYEVPAYAVTFSETGLPPSTNWAVTLGGVEKSSLTSTITFSEISGTYPYTIGDVSGWHQVTLPYTGSVTVSAGAVTEPTLVFTQVTYPVSFSESGLPAVATWYVNFTSGPSGFTLPSGNNAAGSPIPVNLINGTYQYIVATNDKEFVTTATNSLTESAGTPPSVAVTFTFTYSVTFAETGLPTGTSWSVGLGGTLASSTTNAIVFPESNGTHPYVISDVSGWHQATLPYSGTVTVSGAAVTEPTLVFTQVTYSVTFTESGLTPGTEWWVNLTGGPGFSSTTTTLSFAEPNGTHDYTLATTDKEYAASPGFFTVSGATLSEAATFTLVTYVVTFTESGLPSGTTWYLNLTGGPSHSSTGNTISFAEANGSYTYRVATTAKEYAPASATGSLGVNGAPVSEAVTFDLVTYAVTFAETGLPSGTSWAITLGGTLLSSSASTIVFAEPNGTHSYSIADVSGWHQATLSYTGMVTVSGAAVTEPTVAFLPVNYTVTFTESGLTPGTEWWVNLTSGPGFSSTATILSLPEPNGTYGYTVATTEKTYDSSGGTFTVKGAGLSEAAVFKLVTYAITFTQSGLESGTKWWVNFTGGQSFSSTGLNLTVSEANGTYSYSASASGYGSTTGGLTVNGPNLAPVKVTFTSSSSASSALPVLDYEIIGAVVIVAAIGAGVVLMRRRGRSPPTSATPPPQSGAGTPPTSP
jgi:subtilase family serine protease